ncbi:MAG TPA: aminotransferase class III-fold pyridoxal phosphate-dependent enzyme, partial [Hyphomicrobiaceae bacterium]
VLRRYDILMIADEVICGFARTGNWFGSQTFGIQPDTITMAKAITSAYMPLGAVTVSEPVYEAMVDESKKLGVFAHGFTYSGHPVSCAVAVKTLEIYERINIVGHVQSVAPVFETRLKALRDHPLVGETRGVGLIGGVELVKDKATKESFDVRQGLGPKVVKLAEEEGLICRAVSGDTIALCPPLVIDGAEVNQMFDALGRALDRAEEWVNKEGLRG